MRNQGVGSWTARRARMSPDRVAVGYEGRGWTFRELHERATRVAHLLAGHGVGHGDRVAYLGANHPAFLEVLFGTGQLGAVFVPLNWRLAVPELAYILGDSGARVLVFDPAHAAAVAELRPPVAVPVGEEYERALAPVPEAAISAYQRRGVTFMQGYGLTEASPGVLFLRRDASVRKAGSAGTPVFFADVRLERPHRLRQGPQKRAAIPFHQDRRGPPCRPSLTDSTSSGSWPVPTSA